MPVQSAAIKVYTREPDENCYPDGLAHSVHMAIGGEHGQFHPLNKNYGILFAKAQIRPDDTICPKGVKEPRIFALRDCQGELFSEEISFQENSFVKKSFQENCLQEKPPEENSSGDDSFRQNLSGEASAGKGGYGITAVRTHENGEVDESAAGSLLLWTTRDFISFEDRGLVPEREVERLRGEGQEAGESVHVDGELLSRAAQYWNPVYNTGITVPRQVKVRSAGELEGIRATALYSDGSVAEKRVIWDRDGIDFSAPGFCEVWGTVADKSYPFPLASGYGDPVIFSWEEKWYYISTNDNRNDIGLYLREADTVRGLFQEGITEHLILDRDERRELIQTFWAPEFHVIGGELYLLFAVSGKVWGPQCHMMRLKKGRPLTEAESWEDPVRVRKKDGSWLAQDGITLDMTFLKTERRSYLVWSYRWHIGTPQDTGSMLYIAAADEREPWRLASEPVLLSRPLFGWENVAGTINNEGPYAFVRDKTVYLTYSGGSANRYTYALGLLTAPESGDLLTVSTWKKRCAPVLSFYSVAGEYGPGHNSFFTDEDGDLMIAYHGETGLNESLRCDGIRRVHFRKDGFPEFGMSAAEDLDQRLRRIKMEVQIINEKAGV